MSEHQRIVVVEVEHDMIVARLVKQRQTENTVLINAADEHEIIRSVPANFGYRARCDAIPYFRETALGYLVEKFESNVVTIAEALRDVAPEVHENILIALILKEPGFLLALVERKSHRLVQVENYAQPVHPAPVRAALQQLQSAFQDIAAIVKNYVIVKRQAHMIAAPRSYPRDICFCDEALDMFLFVAAL